ncbi:MAG: porin family protein [Porphyrobacter sp.]|jgi:outer membrane immunogenic protein|uniref:outer membrane protein n=1 Tax=Erythrobacter colymbi TaxID=1161202 RepID=UPI000A35F670|nr:outer membrane beta-barrel protein [Erythrobacter colymbi]MBA4766609.1 porin family protein [Porphyrobacter sp.]
MKHAILAAIALAATATPAFAQDAQPFEGPFIGASAGWNRAEAAGRTEGGQPLDGEVARDSVVIGAFAGYDHKVLDRVVLGAEAGFSIALDDSSAGRSAGNQITLDERYSFDLTARAGYLVTDDVLIYARGGYANSRVRTEIEQAGSIATRSDNRDGWLVGGGAEYAISPNIRARVEYRYSDFGSDGRNSERHQTLVGISYKF